MKRISPFTFHFSKRNLKNWQRWILGGSDFAMTTTQRDMMNEMKKLVILPPKRSFGFLLSTGRDNEKRKEAERSDDDWQLSLRVQTH